LIIETLVMASTRHTQHHQCTAECHYQSPAFTSRQRVKKI
jgi:hypothetical protein